MSKFFKLFLIAIFWGIFLVPHVRAQEFEVLWEVDLEGDLWAQMPIIKDGIVYNPWNGSLGTLSAIDLQTGEVLKTVDHVGQATAPFIVGNRIYSYNGSLHEIDLETFQVLRTIPIPNASYTENIPYDEETGYFYARQKLRSELAGRLSAFRLSDGQLIWSFPADYTGGFDNYQSPIVVGDSVFLFAYSAYWRDHGVVFRLNKRTGEEIWSTQLDSTSREGYNNPIYDEDHDVLYFSESWNDGTSRVNSIRRTDGKLLWSHDFSTGTVESTLTYHDNVVYVPLHNFARRDGYYAAIRAEDGTTIWEEPGFFNEDGWSATAVDDRYLYRVAHGTGYRIIVQDRVTGELAWSQSVGAVACCCNPVQSAGIVVLGSERYLWGLKAGTGQAVDSGFHGKNYTGYNPGAIEWGGSRPTPTPSTSACAGPGDVDCDGSVAVDDVLMILRNYGKSPSQVAGYSDPVGDNKINGMDLGYVIRVISNQ